jgi:hypothetical protein
LGLDAIDRAFVVVFEAAAQGVDEHLFGDAAVELGFAILQQVFQVLEGFQFEAGDFAADFDGLALLVLVAPLADGVKVFHGETHRVHFGVAVGAGGIGTVLFQLLAKTSAEFLAVLVVETRDVRRWRWGWITEQLFENPFAAFHRRGAGGIRGHGENARLGEQTAAGGAGQRHALEIAAIEAADGLEVVNLGEPAVDVGVVGVDHVEDAPILAHNLGEE